MRLFGKSGADMITLLNGGSEALERFNYEVSDNFSQNAEYFNDQITILQIQFDGFRKQLLDALLPALNAIIEVFSEMFATENDWTALFKVIQYGIRGTAIVVKSLIDLFDELIRGIVSSFRVIGKVLKGDIPGAIAEVGKAYSGAFDRAKKNKQQYDRLLYGRSEVGADYGGGGRGAFMSTPDAAGAAGRGRGRQARKTDAQKAAEEYQKKLQELALASQPFVNVTFEVVETVKEQTTAFDGVKAAANGYLESIGTMQEGIAALATTGFGGLEDALTSLITTGKGNFLDFARTILAATARMIIQQTILATIMKAIGAIGGGGSPFQAGTTGLDTNYTPGPAPSYFTNPSFGVAPFAKGGIVKRPTMFAFANGGYGNLGLMGEAGAEAILPLKRGRGGRLGVEGGGGTSVVVNVDASGSQVQGNQPDAAQLGRAIGAAVQSELIKQKRPGGLLA